MVAYLQANPFVALLVAYPIFTLLNIVLGVALANFKKTIDMKVFWVGVLKGMVLYLGILVFANVSLFLEIASINLMSTMQIALLVAVSAQAIQCAEKMLELFNYKQAKEIVDNYVPLSEENKETVG